MSTPKMYAIPERFRKFENLHILFWLLKDVSWAMLWKPIGLVMLVPTLVLAILITWRTRNLKSELFHNLAVVFWITANGYWMIAEFFWPDKDYLRNYTVIPFSLGMICIAYYYVIVVPKQEKQKMVTIPVEVPVSIAKLSEGAIK